MQQRFFLYDSLSRLVRAKNPEQGNMAADADFPPVTDTAFGNAGGQWSMGYLYDAAGHLINDSYSPGSYGSTSGQQSRFYDVENRMTSA